MTAFVVFLPDRFERFAELLLFAALSSANVYFAQQDYFSPDAHLQPLLHLWSLGVEEHFYILFPLLMFVLWRFGATTVAVVLSLLLLTSLLASEVMIRSSPSTAFYWIQFRAWELLIGSVMALPFVLPPRSRIIGGVPQRSALFWWPIRSLPTQRLRPSQASPPWSHASARRWSSGAAAVSTPSPGGLGVAPMRYVGLISYSLYLAHWPVIVFIRHLYPDLTLLEQLVAIVPTSFALAAFSYHLVERPTGNRRGIWTWRAIFALSAGGITASLGRQG